MRAVGARTASVTVALHAGIHAVAVGGGLPLDLPNLAREHPETLLAPILSDARSLSLVDLRAAPRLQASAVPFGSRIATARQSMEHLLTPGDPARAPAAA